MRFITKSVAVILAVLMLVSVMPMSVFAAGDQVSYTEINGAKLSDNGEFDLVIDGGNASGVRVDDEEVAFTDDGAADDWMGSIPEGSDLPTAYDADGKGLRLDWDNVFGDVVSVDRKVLYTLYRQQGVMEATSTGLTPDFDNASWQEMTLWDGNQIKVLVVYPYVGTNGTSAKNIMGNWLNTDLESGEGLAGKGLFSIDTVPIDIPNGSTANFNDNPDTYLKDANGEYKYDVLLFGTWDTNGNYDLSKAAADATRLFIEAGHGVVFGHDTVCGAQNLDREDYGFNSFTTELGIDILTNSEINSVLGEGSDATASEKTPYATVVETGVLTDYPWVIRNDSKGRLDVPETHGMFQITGGDLKAKVWMRLLGKDGSSTYGLGSKVSKVYNDGKSYVSDAYLLTHNNVALIQTGHSNGKAKDDERKVFANLLFYLQQNVLDNYSVDHDFSDKTAPVVVEEAEDITVYLDEANSFGTTGSGKQEFNVSFSFSGYDIGTPYKYYVESRNGIKNPVEIMNSNTLEAVANAYLKGYVIVFDNNPSMTLTQAKAAVVSRISNNNGQYSIALDVEGADNQTVTCDTADMNGVELTTDLDWYAHIIPVDKSYNAGEPVTVFIDFTELHDPVLSTAITTNKTDYYPRQIDAEKLESTGEVEVKTADTVVITTTITEVSALSKSAAYEIVITRDDGTSWTIDSDDVTVTWPDETKIEIEVPISDIYTADPEAVAYTATITWYELDANGAVTDTVLLDEEGNEVTDSCEFSIHPYEYAVSFTYNYNDPTDNSVKEKTETQIVTYGGDAVEPDDYQDIVDRYPYFEQFEQWVDSATGSEAVLENVTGDMNIVADYTDPYLPEVDSTVTPGDYEVDEDGNFVLDAEGNKVFVESDDTTYDTRTFDEETETFITDEEVVISYEVGFADGTFDEGEYQYLVGVVEIIKDGETENRFEETLDVVKLDSADPASGEVVIPLEDLYFTAEEDYADTTQDYFSDGEYTVTITWYRADAEGNIISEDDLKNEEDSNIASQETCEFTVLQPQYRVDFIGYKVNDSAGNVEDVSSYDIVDHGDAADAPEVKNSVSDKRYLYVNRGWTMESGAIDMDFIIADSVFVANYHRYPLGTVPEQPEDEPNEDNGKDVEMERLGGETRIETAIKISMEGWDEADVVILATANEFADAMAGVPLAKAVDAPILLTVNGDKLEENVKAEIARLNPEKVYILGRTAAVNANIEAELDALYEVERVGGKDRRETAVYIAYEMEDIYGEKADAVYFVRSDLFPDALSVSSVAAIEHNPILYVAPNGILDDLTVAYSKTVGTEATIIGGTQAVSENAESNIKSLFSKVGRIYGRDRYATAVEVCTAKNHLFTGEYTALATGKKFPDALTGGAFAAKNNSPVLLVNGSVSTELAIYLANRPITKLYIFGGEAAVSEEIAQSALGYCRYLYK